MSIVFFEKVVQITLETSPCLFSRSERCRAILGGSALRGKQSGRQWREAISRIWTIGHSTRPIADFIGLLQSAEVEVLVDVRSFPGSRRYPQFNKENFQRSLPAAGIEYVHMPELGGRRRAKPDSLNMAWRNESFRGYADYMETEPFRAGIERLMEIAKDKRLAIMCSEAVWWRCHRSLIADYLKARGVKVLHILSENKIEEHPFTSAARIVKGDLSYRGVFDPAAD